MMTPTRKSGRQPKPSAKLKEFLYDNDTDKTKDSSSKAVDKKKTTPVAKEPVSRAPEKKRGPQPKGPQPKDPQPKGPQPKGPQPKGPQPKAPQPKGPQPKAPQPKGPQPKAPQSKQTATRVTRVAEKPSSRITEKTLSRVAQLKLTRIGEKTGIRVADKTTRTGEKSVTRVAEKRKAVQIKQEPDEQPPEKKRAITLKKEPEEPKAVEKKKLTTQKKEAEEPKAVEKKKLTTQKKEAEEPKAVEKKKLTTQKKETEESKTIDKKKVTTQKKAEPAPRAAEKRRISQVEKESPEATPSRKSRRTPKPSLKLEEFVYDDERDKTPELPTTGLPTTGKKGPKESERPKRTMNIKEEIESPLEDSEDEFDEESEEEEESDSSEASVKKAVQKQPKGSLANHSTGNKRKSMTSPRAKVTSMTSISAKKVKNQRAMSRLTMRKGKIYTTTPAKQKEVKQKKVDNNSVRPRMISTKKMGGTILKEKISVVNRGNLVKSKVKTTKAKGPATMAERVIMPKKSVTKDSKGQVEKEEIEKVLQVNKEVMTQLLNFGAEVAEAMACNNESIFSFSTKDNPLKTFKIDKQDDFSDEEVIKIIKWFEEEEEQRRAYRKRILEALRASHETNMSLYTQMLKMLQSVTSSC